MPRFTGEGSVHPAGERRVLHVSDEVFQRRARGHSPVDADAPHATAPHATMR